MDFFFKIVFFRALQNEKLLRHVLEMIRENGEKNLEGRVRDLEFLGKRIRCLGETRTGKSAARDGKIGEGGRGKEDQFVQQSVSSFFSTNAF